MPLLYGKYFLNPYQRSYAMLCYAMLCYAMLCYAMLCYAMLCYAMLYYPGWMLAVGEKQPEDFVEVFIFVFQKRQRVFAISAQKPFRGFATATRQSGSQLG